MASIWLEAKKQKLDGSVKKAAYAFLEKLGDDDTAPGLHIEPINGTLDARVRTGRINDFWRALLFKLSNDGGNTYVYFGAYPHDEAISLAKKVTLSINPLNGAAELVTHDSVPDVAGAPTETQPKQKPKPEDVDTTVYPLLETQGIGLEDLLELGIARGLAERVLSVTDGDALLEACSESAVPWQGEVVLDLAFGKKLDEVRAAYALDGEAESTRPTPGAETDDELLTALRHPAAQLQFAYVEDDEALRSAIEDEDFGRWRVFLHPEQRKYVTRNWNGAFRLTGGAGTGKTVVLLHRARRLLRDNPDARIVLTTFNKTLADSLRENLLMLQPDILLAEKLGQPGVFVAGIDAIARRVIVEAGAKIGAAAGDDGAVSDVLGVRTPQVLDSTPGASWNGAAAGDGSALPDDLRSDVFLKAEYATVVLPNRIRTRDEYLRVRRPGRGVALDRARRNAVWDVVEAYRAAAAAHGTTDFEEKAMIAATYLDSGAVAGAARPADHVLVDEAQDLGPTKLRLVRALVAQGKDDVFLAEDAHQRIYGQRIVMSRYGINIVGRSRRLTLNYRTTAQVLHYAVNVLGEETFSDAEADETTVAGYRSARTGPSPQTVATTSTSAEYDEAAERVRAWLAAGEQPHAIGLLTYTRHDGESLARALSERGIEARFVDGDTSVGTGKVVVMTMHRSKGMEFRRVVLFDVGADSMPGTYYISKQPEADRADALRRERSLLYVAATRARDELVVMWKGKPSTLLPG